MYTEYSRKNEGYCQKTNAVNIHKQVLLNLNHISYSSAYTAHIFCMYCMKVYGPLLTWVKHKPSAQINSALQINLILQPIWVPALRLPERQLLCSNRAPGGRVPENPTCVSSSWWNAPLPPDQRLQHHGQGFSQQTMHNHTPHFL